MAIFTVTTLDGDTTTLDDNPEAFLTRWKEAMLEPERDWPQANTRTGETIVNGISYKRGPSVVHFSPYTIVAVEIKTDSD